MAPRLTAQDKQWQRESDAHTLAQAEEIRSSPGRMKGAIKEAKVMAKRTEQQAKAMNKVATGGMTTQSNTKLPIHKNGNRR